jgi:hypothetical protein
MIRRPSVCLGQTPHRHAVFKQNKSRPTHHPQQNDPVTRG